MPTQRLLTKSFKASIGLRHFNVLRGLPFNSAATLSSSSCECKDRSVPWGKVLAEKPVGRSYVCQGWIAVVIIAWAAHYMDRPLQPQGCCTSLCDRLRPLDPGASAGRAGLVSASC